jgi:hypothetical protein
VPGAFHSAWSTLRTITSIEDRLRILRLVWITPGLALVTTGVHGDHLELNRLAAAPRIAIAVDLTGDGKTWLRASSGLRIVADVEALRRFAEGSQVQRNCRWDSDLQAFTKGCVFSGGLARSRWGSPVGPTVVGTRLVATDPSSFTAAPPSPVVLRLGVQYRY